MKFSEQWLRTWVNPPIDTQALCDKLTMAGLEVEGVEPVAPLFHGVKVGQVRSLEPHPNADRLRVCQVDIGEAPLLNIVCGAANVRSDLKVAVATLGAELPNDFKIKAAKLRGVDSQGMLCSASELGLADSSEGILELPSDAPIGKDIRDYLNLDDQIIEVNITPNRGDCLSIAGLARDLSAITDLPIQIQPTHDIQAAISDVFPIEVSATEACPKYLGRVIRGINKNARTPAWLVSRIERAGIGSIHPVVDICNYVMLELGQPLHAFDLAKLNQGIKVRFSQEGEKISLLNGQELALKAHTLVIADHKQAQAVAGVMGAATSSIGTETADIFLESAYFNPGVIINSTRTYQLQSDSSHRYERGVDPLLPEKAMQRACELILDYLGGAAGPVIAKIETEKLPTRTQIKLRMEQVQRILGLAIPEAKVIQILQSLGMQVDQKNEGLLVQVPSYRFDMVLEIDLIEEIARIYGYDNIPTHHANTSLQTQPLSNAVSLQQFRNTLVDHGYQEVITYSFVDPKLQELLIPNELGLALLNPISVDMSVMRLSLWPGLVQTVLYNQNRQQNRIRLFETGLCFVQDEQQKLQQQRHIAGIVLGANYPEQWGIATQKTDFYDVKQDMESLFEATQCRNDFSFIKDQHPALHPGQTARIERRLAGENKFCGYIGALHPRIMQALDLNHPVFVFELNLDVLEPQQVSPYRPLSKFPSVRRDLAIIVNKELNIEEIKTKIIQVSGNTLKKFHLFDIYQGKHIASDKKSVAIGLTFQDETRTLLDNEVNELMHTIMQQLQHAFNATLRD
jgi:phenylalanyl-tRNA synthetase beta chain